MLRSRVEMMLLRQDQQQTLDGTADEIVPPISSAKSPERVGRYSIRRILGEGGMGVVYLAEQDRPRRTVALKVIRPGLLTPRLLRRFEHESEVLARLQHAGIAQIYEAATHESEAGAQPFFAMELVEGKPLTHYAFERHLSLKQRLELFQKICDAVQHAHQKGVIHRDLKPSNILVTASGQPKILDFGIARAADDSAQSPAATMRTEAGTLVGTLPYMSPEQIGDPSGVDVRSDVYTLGVILFELLSGKLPHALETHTLPEAVRIISESDAPSLNSIDRTIPADLATIVSKSMEKDRTRRYQSASDLSADIGRFLRDEPILARPPSRAYKVRKFVRRNRALVTGATIAVLALLGGVVGTTWQAAEAMRGRRLAEVRGVALEKQKQIAEREAQTARAVNLFLTRMLEGANPESDGSGDVSVQQLLASAIEELELTTPPPTVEVPVRVTIAGTFRGMGKYKEAIPQMERACEVAVREFGEADDRTLDARRNLAFAYADAGRTEDAEELTKRILPVVVRNHGEDSLEAARVRCELGRVLIERGELTDAENFFRAGLSVLRPRLGDSDREVQQAMHNFGTSLSALGKLDEAERLLRETAVLREATYGKDHLLVAYTLNSLTSVLQRQGKKEEALALLQQVLAMRLKHLQPDHPSVLVSKGNLAVGLVGVGRVAEAEPLLRQVAEAQVRTLGETHQKTLSTMGNLAYVLEESKKPAEAEALYRRILALRKESGQMDADSWNQYNNLAMLLQAQERFDEALGLYEELLAGCRGKLPEDHWALAIYRNNYGQCLTEAGRYEQAAKELAESHAVLLAFFKDGHPRVLKSQERIEILARESKKHGLALPPSASR
ncbi:MAG: serine/threonine protein kinase [Phycisphaeraceae bacterium]|nr:serine/threonine protein kinase [Phycisphaeraceae bacterium]